MSTSLIVIDDEAFARTTVSAALQHEGFHVLGSYARAPEALAAVKQRPPDAAVVDLDLGPGPTGIDIAWALRGLLPKVGVVLLTSFADPRLLSPSLRALPAGSSYVVKTSLADISVLTEAIRASLPGPLRTTADVSRATDLSESQIDLLRLVAAGLSNAEIARIRGVEEDSIVRAISRLSRRMGVRASGEVNPRIALARRYYALTGAARSPRAI